MKIEVTVQRPIFSNDDSGEHKWEVRVTDDGGTVVSGVSPVKTTRQCEGTEDTWQAAWEEARRIAGTVAAASASIANNTDV